LAVNGARMVARLASREPSRRLAAVLRPCEERALVELVKLKQADLEKVFTVVIDCPGACERAEAERLAAGPDGMEGAAAAVRSAACEPESPGPELRSGCAICTRFLPGAAADVAVQLFGRGDALGVRFSDRLAHRVEAEALGLEASDADADGSVRSRIVEALTSRREASLARELEALSCLEGGIEGLLAEVAACIRCGACRQACPICFCRRCTFDMPAHEHEPEDFLRWADRKGAARLPEDVLLYHLTRLAHVALSCSACGSCESACPQGIKLTRLFAHVGPKVRAPFEYVPGRSFDDPLPLSSFEQEELEPR
jgi:formate dehydrogenase subunit beta